jgi:hypothetical protein
MNRVEFNAAMQGEVRTLLQKHEKERIAVKVRDDAGDGIKSTYDLSISYAARELDMAICLFSDRIYDLVKGDDSE